MCHAGDFHEHISELKKIPRDLKKPYGVIIADSNYGITKAPTNDVPTMRAYEFDSPEQRWGEADFTAVLDIAEDYEEGQQTRVVFFLSDKQFFEASKALKLRGWAFKAITWVKASGRPLVGKHWGQETEHIWFCWKVVTGPETERFVEVQPEDPELYATAFLKKSLKRSEMFQYHNAPLNMFEKPVAIYDRIYNWTQSPGGLLALDVTCGSGTALVSTPCPCPTSRFGLGDQL